MSNLYINNNVILRWKNASKPALSLVTFMGLLASGAGVLTFLGVQPHKMLRATAPVSSPSTTAQIQPVVPASSVRKPQHAEGSVTQISRGKNAVNVDEVRGSTEINYGAPPKDKSPASTPATTAKTETKSSEDVVQVSTGTNAANINRIDGDLRLNYNSPADEKRGNER